MKLNPIKWLLNDEDKKTPGAAGGDAAPDRGAHAIGGREHARLHRRPRTLLPGACGRHADGVTLLARCLDDQVVRGQIAARYPQAQIHEIPAGDDPLRLGEDEQAWSDDPASRRPRVRPPAHLPGRRPARPRLRPADRPHGRAVEPEPGGARGGAAAAALPGTRLVGVPPGQGPQAAGHGAEGTRLHLPN